MTTDALAAGRDAFLWACALDVATPKPGNVSIASPGHGMQAAMFEASALAAAPRLFEPGAPVGARIEAAMQASLAAAGCNTNLGIVLLAAPLAAAFERVRPEAGATALRRALGDVLGALDVDDAAAAFRAIAATRPGGLGRVEAHDVTAPASITLLEAMRLAAARDRVAHQYASNYEDVFDVGSNRFVEFHRRSMSGSGDADAAARHAMLGVYLELLARSPDSHIARRHGEAVAHTVMEQTLIHRNAWIQDGLDELDARLVAWDSRLKGDGLNPGTTADLCVTCATVAAWLHPELVTRNCLDQGKPATSLVPSERTDPLGHGS